MQFRKILPVLLLTVVLALIVLTWGSVGSAALTLGLLVVGSLFAVHKAMDRDDYYSEE